MSEPNETLGREPIQLVEILLPKCANTYGVSPCTATGAVGSECFNCRATCQSPDDYQALPLGNLTAADTLLQGATGSTLKAAAPDRDFYLRTELTIPLEPEGLIFQIVGAATGIAAYFQSGELVVRGGDITAATSTEAARLSVNIDDYLGRTVYLYTVFNRDIVASQITAQVYIFDPVDLELYDIGQATSVDASTIANGQIYGIGVSNGSYAGVEVTTPYNGTIFATEVFDGGLFELAPEQEAYRQRLFLGRGVKGNPDVGRPILTCLNSLATIGTKINLSGADDDYKPLGRRATLDFTVTDFTHSDIGQDPYVATRLYDPFERSTFWRKWLSRQKFGKVGARVRVYDGYAGQPLSAFNKRGYVMEETKINEDGLSFYCRDELARTELLKAQVPAASPGSLDVDIDATQTTLTMNGDFTEDYPAAGTLRINDELMTYTSVAYSDPTTTFSGLTRGTDGSTASDHSADDSVQECRRITGTVEEVVTALLTEDAKIEAQLIDLAGLASEQALYLNAYTIDTVISEPTGVDTVLGWVCQECQVYIWWDERQQQIRIKGIRAISAADISKTLTHEDNIVAGTFRAAEKPRQRLNSLTIYFNPVDFAGDLGEVANFANGLKVVNGTNSGVDQYGNVLQAKTLFSRLLKTEAEVAQTAARIANRYADVPFEARLVVDAKDRAIWTGDIVKISTPVLSVSTGMRDVRQWLIIEAEEIDPGHSVQYTVADVTLDGFIYTITENDVVTYTPELFALGNAFITDNNGLNPDGTNGARIS